MTKTDKVPKRDETKYMSKVANKQDNSEDVKCYEEKNKNKMKQNKRWKPARTS